MASSDTYNFRLLKACTASYNLSGLLFNNDSIGLKLASSAPTAGAVLLTDAARATVEIISSKEFISEGVLLLSDPPGASTSLHFFLFLLAIVIRWVTSSSRDWIASFFALLEFASSSAMYTSIVSHWNHTQKYLLLHHLSWFGLIY